MRGWFLRSPRFNRNDHAFVAAEQDSRVEQRFGRPVEMRRHRQAVATLPVALSRLGRYVERDQDLAAAIGPFKERISFCARSGAYPPRRRHACSRRSDVSARNREHRTRVALLRGDVGCAVGALQRQPWIAAGDRWDCRPSASARARDRGTAPWARYQLLEGIADAVGRNRNALAAHLVGHEEKRRAPQRHQQHRQYAQLCFAAVQNCRAGLSMRSA
ncbi:hypothetical protein H1B27_08140 [Bradyrhizobium sp. CNPSo 4019]|uniref:Uncharacterized protein n=1 Tax=Bradyrhizobium diversitatis TaxID=2755406 RepID=A0ABS0NZ17_9BRAD|nr:hypothetical protein [Bradyrhizobium diversitatis]